MHLDSTLPLLPFPFVSSQSSTQNNLRGTGLVLWITVCDTKLVEGTWSSVKKSISASLTTSRSSNFSNPNGRGGACRYWYTSLYLTGSMIGLSAKASFPRSPLKSQNETCHVEYIQGELCKGFQDQGRLFLHHYLLTRSFTSSMKVLISDVLKSCHLFSDAFRDSGMLFDWALSSKPASLDTLAVTWCQISSDL